MPDRSLNTPPARPPGGFLRRTARRAFTIPEVAMAAFVMALGISSSIIALQMGFRALDVARNTTLAAQIMQSEIERLRLLSWSNITALDGSNPVDLSTTFASNPALAARFSVTRNVVADSTRPGDVRNITLTVSWNGYDGRSQTREFTTVYARNGLYDYYYTLAQP